MALAAEPEGKGHEPQLEPLRAPLMRFFLRRVRDAAEAQDLTQEVFVRLLATADRTSIADPKAFVFQIALNLLADRGRKAQRRSMAQTVLIDPHLVSEVTHEFVEEFTPERVLIGRTEIDRVVAALNELSQRTRDIYLLHRLENLKQARIAELFGISRSTVEKEVMKANMHLARRFGARAR